MTQAYPLQWPPGWPRTKSGDREDGRSRFRRGGSGFWTFAAARDALYEEAARMGSPNWNTVLSSDFALGRNGEPRINGARPADQGVALYMRRNSRPYVMACDRFLRAEENMRSLALAIDAMRQLERHGGGVMMEKAFDGFAALPSPGETAWWEVLGLSPAATRSDVDCAFRRLAAERHPDKPGGSDAMMAELNRARDQGRREAKP